MNITNVRKIKFKKIQRKFIKRLSSEFNGIKIIKCLSLFAWLMMFMWCRLRVRTNVKEWFSTRIKSWTFCLIRRVPR